VANDYLVGMQLTRERIVAAAVELVEREGVTAISMRRIAAELGCAVMSLYNHVPSKDALLDGVAEHVMSGIEVRTEPGASWQDQVRAQARAFRQIARAHPRCTMVVVSRPSTSAAALRPVERALATLTGAGFGGADSVRIVRAFIAYVMGCLLREVGIAPSMAHPDEPARSGGQLDPAEFPLLTGLSAELAQRDHDADFEFGLDLLVRAAARLRPESCAQQTCVQH
jgi:AcrR family transcriptional regulator